MTWEWLGQGLALDIANTVAVEGGVDRDLWNAAAAYDRWVAVEAAAAGLPAEDAEVLAGSRAELQAIREPIRAVLASSARGEPLPDIAIARLNAASRAAPEWLELERGSNRLVARVTAPPIDRLVADYARAALRAVSGTDRAELSICPAPSCGMFFRRGRTDQTWCSRQCGTRARVARHQRRARTQ